MEEREAHLAYSVSFLSASSQVLISPPPRSPSAPNCPRAVRSSRRGCVLRATFVYRSVSDELGSHVAGYSFARRRAGSTPVVQVPRSILVDNAAIAWKRILRAAVAGVEWWARGACSLSRTLARTLVISASTNATGRVSRCETRLPRRDFKRAKIERYLRSARCCRRVEQRAYQTHGFDKRGARARTRPTRSRHSRLRRMDAKERHADIYACGEDAEKFDFTATS